MSIVSIDQNTLKEKKNEMQENIKHSDFVLTKKTALMKFYKTETKKIYAEETRIRDYYNNQYDKFYNSMKNDIELCEK